MDGFSYLCVVEIFLAIVAAYHIGKGAGYDQAIDKFGKKKGE